MCMYFNNRDRAMTNIWKWWRRITRRPNITVYKMVCCGATVIVTPFSFAAVEAGTLLSDRDGVRLLDIEQFNESIHHGIHAYQQPPTPAESRRYLSYEHLIKCTGRVEDVVMKHHGRPDGEIVLTKIEIPQSELDRIMELEHI